MQITKHERHITCYMVIAVTSQHVAYVPSYVAGLKLVKVRARCVKGPIIGCCENGSADPLSEDTPLRDSGLSPLAWYWGLWHAEPLRQGGQSLS